MVRKKGLWLGLLVVLLLWPVSAVLADEPGLSADGGRIFVDEDVNLEPGETFSGDLGVINGNATVPQGSVVNGDLFVTNGNATIGGQVNGSAAVISGNLTLSQGGLVEKDSFVMTGNQDIAGQVNGSVSVMFGKLTLRSTAVVKGDVAVLSGELVREPGAQVQGQEVREIPLPNLPFIPERLKSPELPVLPALPAVPALPEKIPTPFSPAIPAHPGGAGSDFGRFVARVVAAGFFGILFIALGLLIVFIWPRPMQRVSDCIAAMPLQSFGLGLLTFLIAAVLEALAAVVMILIILVAAALISTIILIPVGILLILLSVLVMLPVPLALAAAMVMGWVSLAERVGRGAVKVLKAGQVQVLGATLVGLLITVALAAILWVAKPLCCAWPFIILLTSLGLGAVFHTRFGTQGCRPPAPPAAAALLPPEAMDEEAGRPDVMPPSTP
jgi:Polymer-forming cytoskeletal